MINLEKNKYYIWLSSIKDITVIEKLELLEIYKNPMELFYKTEKQLLEELQFFESIKLKRIVKEIINESYKNILESSIKNMKRQNIEVLTINDEKYPNSLKGIYDSPICIYYKGNIRLLNNQKKIAIIGCRDYTEYGRGVSKKFAYELGKKGIIIISGCARGIDSFAHQGCLCANKETIAVLGNGLDYIYPPENKQLEEQILEKNGLIITEYIVGTKPSKYTFPARNRIISALSDGILVVEAKEKSGTLITVDFGLEQGKNIYVIPGDITRSNSKGTNELIKQGAKLVTNVEDILEDILI